MWLLYNRLLLGLLHNLGPYELRLSNVRPPSRGSGYFLLDPILYGLLCRLWSHAPFHWGINTVCLFSLVAFHTRSVENEALRDKFHFSLHYLLDLPHHLPVLHSNRDWTPLGNCGLPKEELDVLQGICCLWNGHHGHPVSCAKFLLVLAHVQDDSKGYSQSWLGCGRGWSHWKCWAR